MSSVQFSTGMLQAAGELEPIDKRSSGNQDSSDFKCPEKLSSGSLPAFNMLVSQPFASAVWVSIIRDH